MEYIYPDYYPKFQCIASACEDTCCAGWGIVIDDASLEKYRNYPGSFGNRLRNSIDWKEKMFEQVNRRCAFLDEQGLCDIYGEAGEEALCKTCKRYPRHVEEFENLREVSLSLSCPEAARMILGNQENVTLKTSVRKSKTEEYQDFDFFLFTKLQQMRDFIFQVMQSEERPLPYRFSLCVAAAHDMQGRINRGELFEIDRLVERFSGEKFQKKAAKQFEEYQGCPVEGYDLFKTLTGNLSRFEVLNPDWTKRLKAYREALYSKQEVYTREKREFNIASIEWEQEYVQIFLYFVFGYLTGSVYDRNPYDKVRFALVNTLLLRELELAQWMCNNRNLTFPQRVDLVHSFARELEHSDPNLDELEIMISYEEEYELENLLYCIWN